MNRSDMLARLFDSMPMGVVAMDHASRVVFYNRFEEKLAGRQRVDVVGRRFFDEIAPCTEAAGLKDYFLSNVESGDLDRDLMFAFPRPCVDRPRDVRLTLSSLKLDDRPMGVLFVQDVSIIRAVERTKDFLVRTLAHDMNNPLMAVGAGLELFESTDDPAARARFWNDAIESIERLRMMVLNLHDITNLHTSEVPLTIRDCDLGALATDAIEDNRACAAQRSIAIEMEELTAKIEAEVDAGLIRRAIGNMLENAVRFTEEGGSVSVRLRRRGSRVACEIVDQGPGVAASIRERIFSLDVSFGGGFVAPSDHRGLGLAFVNLVAREHGGSVMVDCPATGGSVFTLELPVTRPTLREID